MKTSELTGVALDWAVAKSRGQDNCWMHDYKNGFDNSPSTDWAQGGPLIEREEISLRIINNKWFAETTDGAFKQGETPLIAGMRCFVTAWLGDDVEIPKELTA